MQYREDKYGNKLSVLGFGCMRFTHKGANIDYEKAEREVLQAIKKGVNYFDTAYVYPGSEDLLGKILHNNELRDQVRITTKLPHYLIKKYEDLDLFFYEELKRLQTDHVEVYLMHMLTDLKTWKRLLVLGIDKWIKEKKQTGEIGQIGFSYHGNSDVFCQLLNAYDWDICQIQYNYMDVNTQAGVTGLKAAAALKIPVIIMEPLRGGRLANRLPKGARKAFASSDRDWSPAVWGFQWLWSQPEVTCVLSGMNSLRMVKENCRAAHCSRPGLLTAEDYAVIKKVVAEFNKKIKVPCTGCRYCMPCPSGVDIPGTFAAYNRVYSENLYAGLKDYFMCTAIRNKATDASKCIGCGRCETRCPQSIAIRDELKRAHRVVGGPPYQIAKLVRKASMKY